MDHGETWNHESLADDGRMDGLDGRRFITMSTIVRCVCIVVYPRVVDTTCKWMDE